MSKTITRLFDDHSSALAAVEDLERAGIDDSKISIISNNAENWHERHRRAGGAPGASGPLGDRNGDGENDVAEGAGKGATTGGLIGGGAGLLAGLGMLAIPGLGPVVAAGWLASTAVGAAVGAAAGGAAGGLLGMLKEAGHTEDEANVYSEGVRRGGTLVSVKAHDEEIAQVEAILDGQQGVTAATRGEAYRQDGWARFDADAAPFGVEEIAMERARYRVEARSFGGAEPTDRTLDDGPESPPPTGAPGLNRPL